MHLLEHLIRMWDPDQQHFEVGTHILTKDVEDIYLLTGCSHRGRPVVLTGPRGDELSVDDLIDEYYSVGTQSIGGKIPIKHIVDRPLRTISSTIEKVAGSTSSHLTT